MVLTREQWDSEQAKRVVSLIVEFHYSTADALRRSNVITARIYGPRPAASAATGGTPWYLWLARKGAGLFFGGTMAKLNRYLPLLSSLVLVVQTVLTLLNKEQLAGAIGGISGLIGNAPAEVVAAVAALGTAYGLCRKAYSVLKSSL